MLGERVPCNRARGAKRSRQTQGQNWQCCWEPPTAVGCPHTGCTDLRGTCGSPWPTRLYHGTKHPAHQVLEPLPRGAWGVWGGPASKGCPRHDLQQNRSGAFESQRFHSTTVARQCCGRAPPCCRTWTTGPHVKLTCRFGGDRDTAGTVWPPNPLRAWTEVLGGVGTTLWRYRPP